MKSQSKDIHIALDNAYKTLAPYSNKQRWEFDSNLFHLSTIVSHVAVKDKIIDVGCGIGILALALKNLGYDVCGVDKYVFEPSNSYNVSDIDGLKKIWKGELNKIAKLAKTQVIEVGAKQTTKPHFNRDFKKWHVSIFRMLAYIIPGTGDTNYIWIQK